MLSLLSCTETISDNPIENIEPETHLFIYPNDGTDINQQKSRLRVHWWGDDPDGIILGYYFMWEGLDEQWTFTTKNDSVFSLPIGTIDTTFNFKVVAVDNGGNGKYDSSVEWKGLDMGSEPFLDENGNGVYDDAELYLDLGLIDQTPAEQVFPIKNSPPTIEWTKASSLPASSLPVITVGWEMDDLDGIESIVQINIALNDTTEYVELGSAVSLVTLKLAQNGDEQNPMMQILVEGPDGNILILEDKLPNLKLNDNNRLYIQAVDISGSKSDFISLPDTTSDWYVEKINGPVLIVDNYEGGQSALEFYENIFNTIDNGSLNGNYNVLDLENSALPYQSITLLETMKMFGYTFWYADNTPSFELLNVVTENYKNDGGKLAISMTIQEATENFPVDLPTLQNFLPIDGFGEEEPQRFLFAGAFLISTDESPDFPNLQTSSTISHVRTYIPSLGAIPVYDLSSNDISGNISFFDASKSLFYIGLPLHHCDGIEGNVAIMMEQLFINEFGLGL